MPIQDLEYSTAVARELPKGYVPIRAIGENTDIDTDPSDIWCGASASGLKDYTGFITIPEKITITGDVNDVVDGTGARLIWIDGLNHLGLMDGEFIVPTGTTPAESVKTYYRVFEPCVKRAGTLKANSGRIQVKGLDSDRVLAEIDPLNVSGLSAIRTIPADYKGFLTSWKGSLNNKQSGALDLFLMYNDPDYDRDVFCIADKVGITTTGKSSFDEPVDFPISLAPLTDIKVRCGSHIGLNLSATAGLSLLLIKLKTVALIGG